MSFDVSSEAYTRFMGRYSEPLAVLFADLAQVRRAQLDPVADDESKLAGAREGHLAELFGQAGLDGVRATTLTVRTRYATRLKPG